MSMQDAEALWQLERDVGASLASAKRTHAHLVTTLETSHVSIDAAVRGEADDAMQFESQTREEMQRIRELVLREMQQARMEIATALEQATRNATQLVQTYETRRKAAASKRLELETHRQERREQLLAAIHRVSPDRNRDWAEQELEYVLRSDPSKLLREIGNDTTSTSSSAWTRTVLWFVPMVLGLVVLSAVLGMAAAKVMARRKGASRRRVVYSAYPKQGSRKENENEDQDQDEENASAGLSSARTGRRLDDTEEPETLDAESRQRYRIRRPSAAWLQSPAPLSPASSESSTSRSRSSSMDSESSEQ